MKKVHDALTDLIDAQDLIRLASDSLGNIRDLGYDYKLEHLSERLSELIWDIKKEFNIPAQDDEEN